MVMRRAQTTIPQVIKLPLKLPKTLPSLVKYVRLGAEMLKYDPRHNGVNLHLVRQGTSTRTNTSHQGELVRIWQEKLQY